MTQAKTKRQATAQAAHKRRSNRLARSREWEIGRLSGIRETLHALFDLPGDGIDDTFCEVAKQRALADALGVPLYFVAMVEQDSLTEDFRYVDQKLVDEWEAWRAQYPELEAD